MRSRTNFRKASDEATAPSRVFEERKKELQRSKMVWRNWFLADIILLLLLTLLAFVELAARMPFITVLWLQIALGLPLIYAAIFFHAQHNREREFLEEYSFKAVVARSLEAYREMLKDDVNSRRPEEKKKFLDFIIDSIKDLHMPPRTIISKHPLRSEEDVKIGLIEKIADLLKRFIPK
jgi:hypothetical protein